MLTRISQHWISPGQVPAPGVEAATGVSGRHPCTEGTDPNPVNRAGPTALITLTLGGCFMTSRYSELPAIVGLINALPIGIVLWALIIWSLI
jgi:hypothetical protein